MTIKKLLAVCCLSLPLLACLENDHPPAGAFKAQTDAMQKAANVNQVVQASR